VLHLVRFGEPLDAFERFLASYRRLEAGVEHRFVLLCKGFPDQAALAPYRDRLDSAPAELIEVPDDGFDLTAYRRAAARLEGAILCYLNSHSVVLADGWLERLIAPLEHSAGLAGSTGSWNSGSSTMRYTFHLPGPYDSVFPDRRWHREQSRRLLAAGATAHEAAAGAFSRPPLRYARTAYLLLAPFALFRGFPAPHIRTNAFAMRSETMLALRFPNLRSKLRAWRLESGRGSITEQVAGMGLGTVVVGRDGVAYEPPDWPESETLWQGVQANLLVADNQTERYRLGDLEQRTLLSKVAWGTRARPTVGEPAE
jgi:hypothetical protein